MLGIFLYLELNVGFWKNDTNKVCLKQGDNAKKKVNCSCVFSAYILKLHFSLGGVCKQE